MEPEGVLRQVPCVGAVIVDDDRRVLLVKRANDPGRGLWSIPGGRCEQNEAPEDACVREIREECGLEIVIDRIAGTVCRRDLAGMTEYVITDYFCSVVGGTAVAGDDATELWWCEAPQLHTARLTDGLLDVLISWGVVPPNR